MKILYLSLHPPFAPERVATGNQVRAAGIARALELAGHELRHCMQVPADGAEQGEHSFASTEQLAARIAAFGPDLILVGYWTLLGALPATRIPVILDFIAPRLLEAMYQQSGTLLHESRQLLAVLPRADHFLAGNQRQADLLLTLLLLSGIDCKDRAPISIVPIATSAPVPAYELPRSGIRMVSAGVDWPWRQSGPWFAVVEKFCEAHPGFSFVNLAGNYPGAKQDLADKPALLSHQDMQQMFRGCQLGLELGNRNTEREFSHSFRLIEYLQCGLPVVANAWLPVAALIREYDAGWLVDSPDQLVPILQALEADPNLLSSKAAGAKRLAETVLSYREACAPLLRYIDAPWKPVKEPFLLAGPQAAQPLSLPAPSICSRLLNAMAVVYRLGFCRKRPQNPHAIVMVTRSDLFPTDHGAAVKIVRTAEALSRQHRDVYLCTDNRRQFYAFHNGAMTTQRYPRWLSLLALPRRVSLLRLLLKGYPWDEAFLYLPLMDFSYSLRALYLATRFPVGAYLAEFPSYVLSCRLARRLLGGRIVLVEHNVEYERLKAQTANLSAHSYQELKRIELRMCAMADAIVTVSTNDKALLLEGGVDPRKLHVIPHGVDVAAYQAARPMDVRAAYDIDADALLLVYHGPYSYAPNLQAMTVMARELLPRLQAFGLKVAVLAIGSKPPEQSLHSDLHFVGSVADLATVLPAADLAVIPLLEGGGTRMKILDYFAAGVPVISTRKGIEGIPVQHGEEALIIDDFDAMAAAIADLASNHAKAREMAERASVFAASLSWDAIATRYLPLLDG